MKKTLIRVVLIGGAALLLLFVGLFAFIYMRKDELVRRATEQGLAYVLDVPVTVQGATLEASAGAIEFRGINIPNPPGYKQEHAMRFGKVRVEADLQSFRTNDPIINLVHVSESSIVMEKKGIKGSNLEDLVANAQRLSSSEPKPDKAASDKKLLVKRLMVDGTKVTLATTLMGGQSYEINVPDIDKKDLGGRKEPMKPAEAVEAFIKEIIAAIAGAGKGIIPDDLLGGLQDSLSGLKDTGKALTDDLKDAAGTAGDAVKGVTDGIGGMFGNKKDEDKNP